MSKRSNILISLSISLLLTIILLPSGLVTGSDDVDISFPDIDGPISSDQTWSGNQTFGMVTIEAGVTVTVSPGAGLFNYDTLSSILVQGNLTAIGTEGSPILFGIQGSAWDRIRSISDGSIHMENCSVRSGNYNIQLFGAPSYFKNVTTYGGLQGFFINSEGNEVIGCNAINVADIGFNIQFVFNGFNLIDPHVEGAQYGVYISNCYYINVTGGTIIDSTTYSIYASSAWYTHVDGCTIENGGIYAAMFTGQSHGSTVENSRLNGTCEKKNSR